MYARRQSLSEFRETEEVKKQNEALKLQAFALQQKNLATQNEIAREKENAKALSTLVTAEKRRAQEILKAEQAVKAALQEKEEKARELAAQVEAERVKAQKALEAENAAKAALHEKAAQMDRLMTQVNTLTGQLGDVQTRAGRLQVEQDNIRNELRSAKAQTQTQVEAKSASAPVTPASNQPGTKFIVLSPDMMERNSTFRHVPYIFEVTPATKADILKDGIYFHYIEDDESRGLGSPGRSGYIKNDGPGDITYRLYNKQQDTWSYPAIIRAGEADVYEYGDNIRVNTVEIIPNSAGTMYRLRFSAGIEQVFTEAGMKA